VRIEMGHMATSDRSSTSPRSSNHRRSAPGAHGQDDVVDRPAEDLAHRLDVVERDLGHAERAAGVMARLIDGAGAANGGRRRARRRAGGCASVG
jgi:hypothetical protein